MVGVGGGGGGESAAHGARMDGDRVHCVIEL